MLSIAPNPKAPQSMASNPATPSGEENREAPRRPASAVPTITGLRLSPHGVEATLVNISNSGVLAECGERLKPGSLVTVVFEGTFTPRSVESRVARNTVASMGKDGRLRYHVGIAFTKPINLGPDDSAPPKAAPEGPVVVEPTARNRW